MSVVDFPSRDGGEAEAPCCVECAAKHQAILQLEEEVLTLREVIADMAIERAQLSVVKS